MEENLLEKTGKDLAAWKVLLKAQNLEKHGQMVAFLKAAHGVGHGYANLIVTRFREGDAPPPAGDDLIGAQYQGKESLKPIYDALHAALVAFGPDVEVAPKKGSVSFRRKRQFALVQPSTKTRIDLGLKYNDRPHGGRLEPSGPFGTMCTHRVQLTDVAQVDADLIALIREAYAEAS